jgi:hypothetical protein
MESYRKSDDKLAKASRIISRFIKVGSKQEINITSPMVQLDSVLTNYQRAGVLALEDGEGVDGMTTALEVCEGEVLRLLSFVLWLHGN